jgi:hypothetical protein
LKIKPGKIKAVKFMTARVKDPLNYSFGEQTIPEKSSFKYFRIIICRDFSWAVPVSYTVQKAWKEHHVIMHTLKK